MIAWKKYTLNFTRVNVIVIVIMTGLIISFFASKRWQDEKLVYKEITYRAAEASEAFMVWGGE